jgi:hypothetical protein
MIYNTQILTPDYSKKKKKKKKVEGISNRSILLVQKTENHILNVWWKNTHVRLMNYISWWFVENPTMKFKLISYRYKRWKQSYRWKISQFASIENHRMEKSSLVGIKLSSQGERNKKLYPEMTLVSNKDYGLP